MSGRDRPAVLAEFAQVVDDPRPAAVVDSGRPVIGYFCSYVPPELFLAAGLYPLRLRGAAVSDSSTGDAYLSHLTCSFARHVVSAVLDGHYDFLSGQVAVNTCDHVRRANDAIVAKSDLGYHGYIAVPRSQRESLLPFYLEELERLQDSLERHFQVRITDDALMRAMAQTNLVRERLAALDELRGAEVPRLTGADLLTVSIAARILLPGRFVDLADELLAAARAAEPVAGIRGRVVLYGGELDDPRFVRVLESQGAHVAGDLLCYGRRGLAAVMDPGDAPLSVLARSYLHQVPCARAMGEFPGRYEALLELCREVRAQGIVFQRIKFCQIWSSEAANLRHRFEDSGLPLLVLDREYGTVSTGQLKTRVQAFLERLGV